LKLWVVASQILLDKPALEILDMLSEDPGMWSEAIRTVHAEALERMRSLLPPGKIFARPRTARYKRIPRQSLPIDSGRSSIRSGN
jgi:hypothetical protein